MSENQKTNVEQEATYLLDHIQDYVETRSEITRLTVLEKTSQGAGIVLSGFIVGFLFFLFFIFIGISLAYVIAELTGHIYLGFLSVGALFLLAGFLVILNKEKWIKIPMSNKIIRNYFEDHEDN